MFGLTVARTDVHKFDATYIAHNNQLELQHNKDNLKVDVTTLWFKSIKFLSRTPVFYGSTVKISFFPNINFNTFSQQVRDIKKINKLLRTLELFFNYK